MLNEISAAGVEALQVELVNPTDQPIDLQGYILVLVRQRESPLRIPCSRSCRRAVSRAWTRIRWVSARATKTGCSCWLRAGSALSMPRKCSRGSAVARHSTTTAGCFPVRRPSGRPNQFQINDNIVINELMYHAPGFYSPQLDQLFDNPEEWIELYNRSQTETRGSERLAVHGRASTTCSQMARRSVPTRTWSSRTIRRACC